MPPHLTRGLITNNIKRSPRRRNSTAPMLPPSSICFPFPTFSACTLTKTSANLAKVVRIRAYSQFSLPFSSDIKSHMFSHMLLAFRSRPLLPCGSGHLCPGGQWKPGGGGGQAGGQGISLPRRSLTWILPCEVPCPGQTQTPSSLSFS